MIKVLKKITNKAIQKLNKSTLNAIKNSAKTKIEINNKLNTEKTNRKFK